MESLIKIESADLPNQAENYTASEKAGKTRQENINDMKENFDENECEIFNILINEINSQTSEAANTDKEILNQEILRDLIFSCKKLKTRASVFLSRDFHFYSTMNSLKLAQKILREFTNEVDFLARKTKNDSLASGVIETALQFRSVIEKQYIP